MDKSLRCKFCNEEFNFLYELNAHIARQHPVLPNRTTKSLECNLCGYKASQKHHLIDHLRTHTGERPFKCTVNDCELAFKQKSNLERHIKSKHSNERSFKCDFQGCGFSATTGAALFTHKKVHSLEKTFACSECEYKTIWKIALKTHRIYHHSARRDFKCSDPQCSKSFKSSVALKLHFSNRHGERTIQCDHPGCDQRYANINALYHHKRNVHLTKILKCPNAHCSYRTTHSNKLLRHMVVHDRGSEKIPCSMEGCRYKGKNRPALEEHMRLHNNLSRCPVSSCGYYAPIKKALKDHKKLHNPSDRPNLTIVGLAWERMLGNCSSCSD